MENLDMKCAELGQALAADSNVDEKFLTDVLGVLEEQGLYAAFLFAKARGGNGGKSVGDRVSQFLRSTPQGSPLADSTDKDVLSAIKDVSKDLDNLLLARDLARAPRGRWMPMARGSCKEQRHDLSSHRGRVRVGHEKLLLGAGYVSVDLKECLAARACNRRRDFG